MQGQSPSIIGMPMLLLLVALVAAAIGALVLLRRPAGPVDRPAGVAEPAASPGRGTDSRRMAGFAMIGAGVVAAAIALGAMTGRSAVPAPTAPPGTTPAPASPGPAATAADQAFPSPTAPAAEPQQAVADAPAAGQAAAAGVVPGAYSCSAFMGVPPNGHLQPMPGFTIGADGSYVHQDGVAGTISVSGNVVEFHGGALDGQAARFDAGPAGRGTIHLYNETRSRTVIDCEGA